MSNYRQGADFEREIGHIFTAAGFDVVRCAGSKGKLAGFDSDLIATKITDKNKFEVGIVIMQAKRSKR